MIKGYCCYMARRCVFVRPRARAWEYIRFGEILYTYMSSRTMVIKPRCERERFLVSDFAAYKIIFSYRTGRVR